MVVREMTSGPFPSPLLLSVPRVMRGRGEKYLRQWWLRGQAIELGQGTSGRTKTLSFLVCMNDSSQFLPQISPMTSIMMLLCQISNQTKTLYGWVFSAVETVN